MDKKIAVAISESEYALHKMPQIMRYFFKKRYPVNLHSGKPIMEFIELADCCTGLGVSVVPHSKIEEFLKRNEPIMKFGKTDLAQDLTLLAQFPNAASEWNKKNLETIGDFNHHLDLGRKTWNIFLGAAEHQQKLCELFRTHGALFIKTVTKGFAKTYKSYGEFMDSVGDISRLSDESLDLFVSEVIEIRQISVDTPAGKLVRSDEWRHHVYRNHLVCTTHAFDCNSRRTDDSGRVSNVLKAQAVIEELHAKTFSTTYVLDTCTLTDGSVAVVEANTFFASGIYDKGAIRAIAEAIAAGYIQDTKRK